jgi:TolB-like protein/DNA-binding winged helix-turn-helix (wHTH) protein/tetratricopeptide (TPR) repeat protein
MSNETNAVLEFGDYRFDTNQGLLLRGGNIIPLAPKAFATLRVLVESQGRVIEKDELLRKIWPDTFVEEGSLTQNISILRKALGENGDGEEFIQTIPKRGYRFAVPVRATSEPLVIEEHCRVEASVDAEVVERQTSRRAIWISGVVLTLALAATAGFLGVRLRSRGQMGDQPIRSVAVLPLQNLSEDPAQEYLSDGMTDVLISDLAQIRSLNVISRRSVMRFKKSGESAPQIGKALGVDALVEGTLQRSGGRVRITAQLIRTATDKHLWAKEYERDFSDVLKLETEVARQIASEIQAELTPEETRSLSDVGIVNPQAQEEYWRGRYLINKGDQPNMKAAIEHFDQAVRIEPAFASAYAGLAVAWKEQNVLGAARSAALQALQLDPNSWEAHEAIAEVNESSWDWEGAEKEFRRAIELNPGAVDCGCYAGFLAAMGRFPEAVETVRRAVKIDPLSTIAEYNYGYVQFIMRRFGEAVPHLERAIELDSKHRLAYIFLAFAYERLGRSEDAIRLLDRPDFRGSAHLAYAYASSGRRAEAWRIVQNLTKGDPPSNRLALGLVYIALGDQERGFKWLSDAFDAREWSVPWTKVSPLFDGVRSDPRFIALVHRLNIPDLP